ncbi:MAG TPA: M24 family metallopeptidase, partial [Rhodopila sp.]|nr:M24 family metallopeptidase [Rhodopila sp.]
QGYIGDVCRMGILGEPDAELYDLLAEIDSVQQAAFRAVRAGNPGRAARRLGRRLMRRHRGARGRPRRR